MTSAYAAGALACLFPCLAMAQIAALHIQITEGEGAVYAAGSHSTEPLSVQITDDAGRPVSGAAVSFRLPDEGPGGVFDNGLRTDLAISDDSGHAAVRNLKLNRTLGNFQVRITASKERARVGTLARQYVAGAEARENAAPANKVKSGKKLLVVLLIAAGAGVAGGVGAGMAAKPAPSTPPKPAPAPPVVTIGAPTIAVGAP